MKRLALLALPLLVLAAPTPGLAAGAAPAASVDERLNWDFSVPEAAPTPLAAPSFAPQPPPTLGETDASLAAPTSPRRLRTTLDPVGSSVDQRIDKALTAAGEISAFPPDYAFGAFQRGWFLTAFSLALDRAKSGDPTAQTLLGVLLSRGLGVKQDFTAAADWYELAGHQGDPEALYALGQLYLDGNGVTEDAAKAAELFREAADANEPVAARELGYLLLQGKGVKKNAMLAAAYMRRAAGFGDMDAQYTLAGLYVDGVGVVADETQAARWFREGAKNGHVGAEVEYAILLFNGRGVPKDESQAIYWFTRAAEADNPVAQLRLARLYANGKGVDVDFAKAARWYLIAKDHGLDDDDMEAWMKRLDPEAVKVARAAADDWARLKKSVLQTAMAPPPAEAPAVDNSTE